MTSHHPHERAAEALRADILGGRFTPGEQLPGQRELAGRYGVAQNTMGEALRLLEREGLVETAPRRRSRVLQPAPHMEAHLTRSGLISLTDRSGLGRNDLRTGTRGTDPLATEALGLAPGSTLFIQQAVLLQGGAPWALQTLFTPTAPDAATAGDQAAIATLLTAGAAAHETRHTGRWAARPASTEERELLRARADATVMEIRRAGFIKERPNSYLLTVVRADRVTILWGSGS
ncbi:GntR family transcriptional regulator [Streptomyces sp. XH2]|uniref:GntR family transcriptional regulator n=1 Tax=Streptomyces sp. XH2 TaxID=3412483 RepID=UPI003C7A755C